MKRLREVTLFALMWLLPLISCAKRYSTRGMVLQVDAPAHTLLISHGDIPDYMPAMTMPFRAPKADLAALHPGAQIEFDLVVGKSASHIERVRRIGGGGRMRGRGDPIRFPPKPDCVSVAWVRA